MPTTLPGRLRARIRQLGMTAADVAALADVNRSFIYDIIRARSGRPSLERLERVATVLKVDSDWLLHGVGHVEGRVPFDDRPEDEFIAVAHAAARPSMGGGAIVEDESRPGRDYLFRRAWIRDKLRAAPSMLRVLQVEGDSMLPTLADGDTVLVDMNQRSPVPPGIFVLHDGMGLVAKRLEHVPMSDPPRLRIISDNPHYTPYECLAEEAIVIGRIRWFAREL
jgi:phage repressor protein C with HTH and peptisase S24 domain